MFIFRGYHCSIGALFLFCSAIGAQTVMLSGQLVAEDSQQPLPDV